METVTGIELRHLLLVLLLDGRRPTSVAELVRAVDAAGFQLCGRAGKSISDALRWEVRRGRVLRVGRGRYVIGRVARSTEYDIRRRVVHLQAHGVGSWYRDVVDGSPPPVRFPSG